MKTVKLLIISGVAILILGCTQSPQPIETKPGKIIGAGETVTGSVDQSRLDDFQLASQSQTFEIGTFTSEISRFRQATGSLPDSLKTLIDSGLLLWWPKDQHHNKPVKVLESGDLIPAESDFGTIKYNAVENSTYDYSFENVFDFKFQIFQIVPDLAEYGRTGEKVWSVSLIESPKENERGGGVYGEAAPARSYRAIIWGKKPIYDVEDYDTRMLYAMCGNLTAFIHHQTGLLYRNHDKLPESFTDLLDENRLIIKESFYDFAASLKNSNADFRWGFDYANNREYITLEIDGEVFIAGTRRFGDKFQADIPGYGIDLDRDFDITTLDTSSPIINSDNLVDVVIPDKYLISRDDIVFIQR